MSHGTLRWSSPDPSPDGATLGERTFQDQQLVAGRGAARRHPRATQGTAGRLGSGIATYAFATGRYEVLADVGEWPVWLPDSRRVLFVAGRTVFYVVDIRTKQVKKILSVSRDVIGPPRLTRDGRTADFSRRNSEADIWMLTMK